MKTYTYFDRQNLEWIITVRPDSALEESLFLGAHDAKLTPVIKVSDDNCYSSIEIRVPVTRKKR